MIASQSVRFNILIAGGSGFIGTALSHYLNNLGHQITLLTRGTKEYPEGIQVLQWDGKVLKTDKQFDIIINLCGQNIAEKRWSDKVKLALIDSRLEPTKALVDFIKHYPSEIKPRLLNASAIGFYPSDPSVQTEKNYVIPNEKLFSEELVKQWEACAQEAIQYGAIVTCLRFGVVLAKQGGMLKRILLPFKFGLGAVMGNKVASLSWIHMEDLCRAIHFLMSLEQLKPAYNLTSPNPCTQFHFAKAVAKACHRPCFLRFPSSVIEKIFGQMGKELLLADQKIIPENLIKAGFKFKYDEIINAINDIINQ